MTHSVDAPFPPPPTTSGATMGTQPGGGSPSTADVAKDEATNVGQTAAQAGSEVASTAAQAGSQVASTAVDQAKEVAQETQRQAMNLVEQGQSQLREQATVQQQKAAQGLSSLAQELRGMVNGTNFETSGPAHDLVRQATDKIEELAGWLQNREPADLLQEVRSYARRRPGTFLLGAAVAGVVAGRLTSGVRKAHSDGGAGGQRTAGTSYPQTRYGQNYVEPTPAYEPATYPETSTFGAPTGTTPVPPPPYGTVPPEGSVVPPATPAGWDDPTRRPGGVG
jgi:hypothetical protein